VNEIIYTRLTEAAKERKLVNYSDLSSAIGLSLMDASGLHALNKLLEEIADHELENGRPLLAAIIVNENTNMPGAGLFNYAKRKGLMKPKDKDNLSFFLLESKRVHDHWSTSA
jgi:hypothetical protein